MVVHREAEQDHEHEDREPRSDPAVPLETEQTLTPAPLEHGHEHAVGRPDGEQVEDDRLQRDHDRPEGHEEQCEREHEHEAEHDRRLSLEQRVLIRRLRRQARDCVLRAVHLADCRGKDVVAKQLQRRVRLGIRAGTDEWDVHSSDSVGRIHFEVDRACVQMSSLDLALQGRDRLLCSSGIDVALDRDLARRGRAVTEGVADLLDRLDGRCTVREGAEPALSRVEVQDRQRHHEECSTGNGCRDPWAAHRRCEHLLPEPVLAAVTPKPVQEGDLALLDPVAELGEQCRQDGQRTEHRDADDHHRCDSEAQIRLVAGEHHPGHCDHHGEAGDQDRASGRCCRRLDRSSRALAGCALLPLPLEVEERVVDADSQPDQQDHGADVLVHRDQVAGQCDKTDRRQDPR